MIPFDTKSPFVTSGIRLGTAALTTKGMGTEEMRQIAKMIDQVLSNMEDQKLQNKILSEVIELSRQFPLYSV